MKLFYLFVFLTMLQISNLEFSKIQETNDSFKFKPLIDYKQAVSDSKKSNKNYYLFHQLWRRQLKANGGR